MLNAVKRSYCRHFAGERYGRLTLVARVGNVVRYGKQVVMWKMKCDCGNEVVRKLSDATCGTTKSCGCLLRETRSLSGKANITHGLSGTAEYGIWGEIKKRCYTSRHKFFSRYGGRGIGMCQQWRESFHEFYKYVGARPSPLHEIDRYPNNDGNYEPGNVRWAMKKEQCRNRSSNRMIEFRGEVRCAAEWEELLGLPSGRIYSRVSALGWTIERALSTPVRKCVRRVA